jgi:hypothetical protein
MYLATLQTTNFEFVALADSVDKAVQLIREQWEYHISDCPSCYGWHIVDDSVNVRPISLNDVLGDCIQCENLVHGAEVH